MDELIADVVEMLRGQTLQVLELARGITLAILYPASRQPALTESQLTTEQTIPRHFWEIVWYEIKPLVIGEG